MANITVKEGDTLTLTLWTVDDNEEVRRPFRFKVSAVPEGDDALYLRRFPQECKGKQYADIQLELISEPKAVHRG
jgi:hypothetical protein